MNSKIYVNYLRIIVLLLIIFLYFIFNNRSTIKNLEKFIHNNTLTIKNLEKYMHNKIKNLDIQNNVLNQQIESIFSYLYNIKNNSCIYQLLKPKDVLGKKKIRIGNKADGGYVLLNDFENIKIAYSFGISNDTSFDKDLADKNIDIFMYDHTIKNLPYQNNKFHWKKIGLTGNKGNFNNLKTLEELIYENGHSNETNMILKLDIEASEWDALMNINSTILKKFKYIIIEYHFNTKFESVYIKILRKLNEEHQIFHLHCNNLGYFVNFDGYNICYTIEVSYIIKENNKFIKSSEYYPIKGLDYKNTDYKIDINKFLNIYQIDNIININ